MILFGTAVGSRDVYGEVALPSIRAVTEMEAAILSVRDAPSIAVAYNQLIQEALSWGDDVEAIALIHDDVEIQDRNFLARVRRGLKGGRIGVLGVIGGRELTSMGWWSGRHLVGRAWDYKGYHGVGPLRGEVDVVDGLLMVVSRLAMERVQFDENTITGFFGYDSDYCLSVKAAGLRVVVEPFRVYHAAAWVERETTPAYNITEARFMEKWAQLMSSPRLTDRYRVARAADVRWQRLHRAFAPGTDEVRRMALDDSRRMLHAIRNTDTRSSELDPDEQMTATEDERSQREAASRLDWVQRWVPEGILLDVGSTSPTFSRLASVAGYEAYRIVSYATRRQSSDLDEPLRDWARKFAGFTVDAITFFETLEYVDAPIEVLRRALEVLSPRGLMFLEVRNSASASALEPHPSEPSPSSDDNKRWAFTPTSLRALLSRTGIEVLEVHTMTQRVYVTDSEWQQSRANDRALGDRDPRADVLRVVARRLKSPQERDRPAGINADRLDADNLGSNNPAGRR